MACSSYNYYHHYHCQHHHYYFYYTFLTISSSPILPLQLDDIVVPSKHPEHILFYIRIQIPFLGKGTQLLVDQEGTLKLNITEKNSRYETIRECVEVRFVFELLEKNWKKKLSVNCDASDLILSFTF